LLDSCVPFGAAQRLGRSGIGTKGVVGCQVPRAICRARRPGAQLPRPGPKVL
jgi:hypothetical protein